jgi:phosphate starvation-inducible PhoH-like protein
VVDAIAEAGSKPGPEDTGVLAVYSRHPIAPKTDGQEAYIKAFSNSDLVFCLGPAGTGKTYLAVAMAVSMLRAERIKRIVLVRPAVEAGEKLGYLPGDMQAKVNPYLRPLFDAMHDMMNFEQIRRFIQNDIIEVIPLAFMRGRTLNNAAVILDEAQNTTAGQMLMFLTRLGHNSKMVVTGDDSQIDLAPEQRSGLVDAVSRLRGLDNIAVIRLSDRDIVRHSLVQDIVNAYGSERLPG